MKDFSRYWYKTIFENQSGDVPATAVLINLTAATNNVQLIAATSGKIIRVVSMHLTSSGAATNVIFKSNSGGTMVDRFYLPLNTSAPPDTILPLNLAGWFETAAGHGLFTDCGAVAAEGHLRYILVDP